MAGVCLYCLASVRGKPVAVIEHIVEIGIYTDEAIEKVAENMEGFAQIALSNILQVQCIFDTGFVKFGNQVSYDLAVTTFRRGYMGEKSAVEAHGRVLPSGLDAVIDDQ